MRLPGRQLRFYLERESLIETQRDVQSALISVNPFTPKSPLAVKLNFWCYDLEFTSTMLKITISHCSNILITISCKNVEYFTLVHAHKPKFGLAEPFQFFSGSFSCRFFFYILYSSYSSGRKSFDVIIGKPWKRVLASVSTDFAPKTDRVFLWLALSECNRYSKWTVL